MARLWCSAGAWFIYVKICKRMFMPSFFRHLFVASLLFACGLNSHAMGLGLAKGTAWIGRPLDVGVQVKLDNDEDPAALCLAVDVLYGDTPVNTGQVRLIVDQGTSRADAILRIQSAVPVDEPVVSLNLKVGCAQALSRQFVLLSEIPVESRSESRLVSGQPGAGFFQQNEPAREDPVGSRADGTKAVRSVGAPRKTGGFSDLSNKGAKAGGMPDQRSVAPNAKPKTAPLRSVARKPEPESKTDKPRLKLDPADLPAERDPVLKASPALLTEPQDGGTQRAEAAARWRAIGSIPEEVVKDGQRLLALQADVALIKELRQKDQAEISELRNRLQASESGRLGREWFLGLTAALIAALAAAFHFWRRSRSQSRPEWWSPVANESADEHLPSPVDERTARPSPGVTIARTGSEKDVNHEVTPQTTAPPSSMPVGRPIHASFEPVDFQNSLSGASRAVKVDELLDIQQQADFFISLGQYDQAVATLKNHIADNVGISVLAYLDLLKVYHLQGRVRDYELVRNEFNELFNAEVPEIAAFQQQTRGLEAYPPILSRITALWPMPAVLDFIEESIFRKPGRGSLVLDLEAYRELLMLYAVAKDLGDDRSNVPEEVQRVDSPVLPANDVQDRDTRGARLAGSRLPSAQPLEMSPQAAREPVDSHSPPLMRVPPSPNVGLDIDLSELVPVQSTETSSGQFPSKAARAKAPDGHLIDFDLFDLATNADARSRRGKG